jgi:hypothetical protein
MHHLQQLVCSSAAHGLHNANCVIGGLDRLLFISSRRHNQVFSTTPHRLITTVDLRTTADVCLEGTMPAGMQQHHSQQQQ